MAVVILGLSFKVVLWKCLYGYHMAILGNATAIFINMKEGFRNNVKLSCGLHFMALSFNSPKKYILPLLQ